VFKYHQPRGLVKRAKASLKKAVVVVVVVVVPRKDFFLKIIFV
jgi:hypothetical protein